MTPLPVSRGAAAPGGRAARVSSAAVGGRPQFEILSFGVFGTLVDRDAGLARGLAEHGAVAQPAQQAAIVSAFHDALWELADEVTEFRPYRALCEEALARAAARSGALLARKAAARIAESAGDWPLFPDAAPALRRLAERWPVALVSSYERADVVRVAGRLGVTPRRIVTAAYVEAYKPEPDLLLALLHELELDEYRLLHVGGVPEFDLFTAEDLGVPAAYVDRGGEGLPEDLSVAWHGPSLDALASFLTAPRPAKPRHGPRHPSGPPRQGFKAKGDGGGR